MAMGSFARNKQTTAGLFSFRKKKKKSENFLFSPHQSLCLWASQMEEMVYPTYTSPASPASFPVIQLDNFQSKK